VDADNKVRRVFADKKPFKGSEICRLKALYAETDSNSKAKQTKGRKEADPSGIKARPSSCYSNTQLHNRQGFNVRNWQTSSYPSWA